MILHILSHTLKTINYPVNSADSCQTEPLSASGSSTASCFLDHKRRGRKQSFNFPFYELAGGLLTYPDCEVSRTLQMIIVNQHKGCKTPQHLSIANLELHLYFKMSVCKLLGEASLMLSFAYYIRAYMSVLSFMCWELPRKLSHLSSIIVASLPLVDNKEITLLN